MTDDFQAIPLTRKTGSEPFHLNGRPVGQTLLDFWRWSTSDLLSNTMRGVLAEYIVGSALECVDRTRLEWDAADLVTSENTRVEVKSAAYLQTWAQVKHSTISFGIAPTHGWDATTNRVSEERKRQADVYVFAVLTHKSKTTIDPLDLAQWEFHVLSTARLNEAVPEQRTIGLNRLLSLGPATVDFNGLKAAVGAARFRPPG